jgi:alkylation response protein AidB-like acyl-CoA dehydrogenase
VNTGHSFWNGVPDSVREDEVLVSMAEYLAQPETKEMLRRTQAEGQYPSQAVSALHSRGLGRLFGPEASAWHLSTLYAELAAADGTLAITVGVNALALLPIYLDATPALRARVLERVQEGGMAAMLLTEWAHGSNLLRNETTARPKGTGFVIDGRKALINGGRRHDLLTVLARTRTSTSGRAAYGDHTLFWVERGPGVEALGRHPTLPTRGADISQVGLSGVEVGADQVIGSVGDGFSVIRRTLSLSRGGISALAAGAAAGMLSQTIAYAHTRDIYGGPILELDAIADHVAELQELEAQCAAVSLRATAFANAFGRAAAPMTAAAKLVAPRLAERAADVGRMVLGSRALLEDHDFARFVRDVTLYGIFDGTHHVMLEELCFSLDRLGRQRRLDAASPLERSEEAWTTEPRPLVELGRRTTSLRLIDPRRLAVELADSGSWSWLDALPRLADELLHTRQRLEGAGRWSLQAVRFQLAEAMAWLDVSFACAEVGDTALLRRFDRPASPDALALDAGGCRRAHALCARLRFLTSLDPTAEADHLADVETQLARLAFETRRRLISALTSA